ncbi:MAG: hypothetical protein FWC16_00625 [Defluviitaleaceae bacterium]|nr:hypothetical protein [Defluviitaleaceae bacterium]MCL2273408.1 hypothetical protein [Defluviitaleaceae bacterium]
MNPSDWKQRAEVLFFGDGKKITEVSNLLSVSVRSISKHFNGLPHYEAEVARRKQAAQVRRKECHRLWKQKSRNNCPHAITRETLKIEHTTAVRILSKERFFN